VVGQIPTSGAPRDPGPTGVLLLDKPPGISSTRALAVAKRLLGSRKAGHTGTLDPFATGLLPIAFGEATKFSRFLFDAPKGYEASLRLGYTSSTGDPEGDIRSTGAIHVDLGKIDEDLRSFMGVQWQTPPMHSALHHQGKRLYELAREGVEVPRAPRSVQIYSLEMVSKSGENLLISVKCSKGTYIRTLAEDIGKRLGCGAFLTALRRTQVGDFSIDEAVSLEDLEALQSQGLRGPPLSPPESLVRSLPRTLLDRESGRAFSQGRVVAHEGGEGGEVAVFAAPDRFLGVGFRDGAGRLRSVRLMAAVPEADCPDFA